MLGHNGIGMVSKDCSNYFLNYLKIHENNTFYFKKFIFNINKINRFLLSKHPSIITSCLKLACICVKNLLMSSTHVCLYLWDIDFHHSQRSLMMSSSRNFSSYYMAGVRKNQKIN